MKIPFNEVVNLGTFRLNKEKVFLLDSDCFIDIWSYKLSFESERIEENFFNGRWMFEQENMEIFVDEDE